MSTTPPRSALPLHLDEVKNTPWSAGCGSHGSFQTQNTQEYYRPYLEADIERTAVIPFENFLSIAFNFSVNANHAEHGSFSTIANSKHFQTLLSKYKAEVGHETERYHPFNTLANHVLAELNKLYPREQPIVFCRNDHIPIDGSSAKRIPDCLTILQSAMSLGERSCWDNLSKEGPNCCPFHWSELLAFLEFKLTRTVLHSPPLSSSIDPTSVPHTGHLPGGVTRLPSSLNSGSLETESGFLFSGAFFTLTLCEYISNLSLNFTDNAVGYSQASTTATTPTLCAGTSLAPPFPSSPRTSSGRKTTSSQKRNRPVHVDNSRKRPRKDEDPPLSRQDTLLQCASYALEMLSHGGLRNHVFGALITDDEIELLYYDRSLPVRSKPLCFTKDPTALVTWLYCMHTSPPVWGRVSSIQAPPAPPRSLLPSTRSREKTKLSSTAPTSSKPLHSALLKLNNGKILELGDLVFQQHALIGRGTCVIRAKVKEPPGDPWAGMSIIVKVSFTPVTRTSEGELLDKIVGIAKKDDPDHWVLRHLPEVLHYEAFPTDATDVQARLSEYLKHADIPYENRVMQVLIMTELFHITELTTSDQLTPVIRHIFRCEFSMPIGSMAV